MSRSVKPIPDGYHTATPYLIVNAADAALEFYKNAFGATERLRIPAPGGKIGHAEITIGDSPIMLADEHPEIGARSPQSFGGSPVSIMLYVEDVDAFVKRAVAAGAKVVRPLGHAGRSGRPRLARRHPQGRSVARGDQTAGRSAGEGVVIDSGR